MAKTARSPWSSARSKRKAPASKKRKPPKRKAAGRRKAPKRKTTSKQAVRKAGPVAKLKAIIQRYGKKVDSNFKLKPKAVSAAKKSRNALARVAAYYDPALEILFGYGETKAAEKISEKFEDALEKAGMWYDDMGGGWMVIYPTSYEG